MKAGLTAAVTLLAACGGAKSAAPTPVGPAVSVTPLANHRLALPERPQPARSHLVATLGGKSLGPFLARSTGGGLVAWIAAAQKGGGQALSVVPVGQDGAPFGEPHEIATVPQEATSLVVRPSGTPKGGWLLGWSALLDRGESVSLLGVGPDGTARGTPYDVQRTTDHVKWLDVVPLPSGGMCVWAEETPAGDANVLVAPLDGDGKPRGLPVRMARGMLGWAAARDGDGLMLALVGPAPGDTKGRAGTLSVQRVDADGHARGGPVVVSAKATVSGDVDLTAVAGGPWLLGWTDRTGEDAQVVLATVDASGKVTGPTRAMDAVGGATLVGLASGPAGTALAWTEPRGRARPLRAMHLAAVALDGPSAQPVTSLDVVATAQPELAALPHGFAMLAAAPVCESGSSPACDGQVAPTFLRFDARLMPAQTEPMFVGPTVVPGPASLGWSLRCLDDTCVTLAADAASPAGVYVVDLKDRASPFSPPTRTPVPSDAPRVSGLVTVASGEPFADIATARLGDETLLATLTTAIDSEEPKTHGSHAAGAVVGVRRFDADGRPLGPTASLSTRAQPAGGVAVAPAGRPDDGAAIVWVAKDDGDPQVHVARLDRRGRRTNEVQLTTAKGDASDVAIAWAGDGWLVAWVDARDGNGEVYATKVDRDLQRTSREQRITKAPGDAGDVTVVVRGDTAWLAWSDPRESPREGMSDIYAAVVSVKDASRVGDDARVLSTAAHSRSPSMAVVGDGAIVAWVEDAPQGLEARGTAMVARLDGTAHVTGVPVPLPLADAGNPSTLAVDGAGDAARVVVARSDRDDVSLDAVSVRRDGTPAGPAWRLLDLDAPATFDVSLALSGDAVFFDDLGTTTADHRVRRAALVWRR